MEVGGWVCVLDEIKAISAQLGLGFGLSLTKIGITKLNKKVFWEKNEFAIYLIQKV